MEAVNLQTWKEEQDLSRCLWSQDPIQFSRDYGISLLSVGMFPTDEVKQIIYKLMRELFVLHEEGRCKFVDLQLSKVVKMGENIKILSTNLFHFEWPSIPYQNLLKEDILKLDELIFTDLLGDRVALSPEWNYLQLLFRSVRNVDKAFRYNTLNSTCIMSDRRRAEYCGSFYRGIQLLETKPEFRRVLFGLLTLPDSYGWKEKIENCGVDYLVKALDSHGTTYAENSGFDLLRYWRNVFEHAHERDLRTKEYAAPVGVGEILHGKNMVMIMMDLFPLFLPGLQKLMTKHAVSLPSDIEHQTI